MFYAYAVTYELSLDPSLILRNMNYNTIPYSVSAKSLEF